MGPADAGPSEDRRESRDGEEPGEGWALDRGGVEVS